jgi:ribosome-binding factor A
VKGKDTRRIDKLGDLIREEISTLLIRDVKDPRIKMLTITGVEVSRDIRTAKVFYTVGGGQSARKETQRGLESAVGFIKTAIAHNLTIKRVPELTFIYDSSLEYGQKIDRILEGLKEE